MLKKEIAPGLIISKDGWQFKETGLTPFLSLSVTKKWPFRLAKWKNSHRIQKRFTGLDASLTKKQDFLLNLPSTSDQGLPG